MPIWVAIMIVAVAIAAVGVALIEIAGRKVPLPRSTRTAPDSCAPPEPPRACKRWRMTIEQVPDEGRPEA